MDIWKELTKVALLGTERAKLGEALQEALQSNGLSTESAPEQQVLEGLAFFSTLQKASFGLGSFQNAKALNLPKVEQYCSPEAIWHLNQILEGPYPKALREFIWYLQKSNTMLAPELLPDLFYKALSDRALWQRIEPLIGQRGQWLLNLNADWERIQSNPNVELWPTGTKEMREAILRFLRKERPEDAIPLLESTWDTESVPQKLAFLKTLDRNLNDKDEAFLERCLSDKRKEVRLQSAQLLKHLPNSGWQLRMQARADQWIELDSKLRLHLPEKLDKASLRDGLLIDSKRSTKRERERKFVEYMGEVLPPAYWENRLSSAPDQCLDYLYSSPDYGKQWLLAIQTGLQFWTDPRWQEAILDFWLRNQPDALWNNKTGKAFIEKLPNSIFNTFIRSYLKRRRSLLQEDHLVCQMLCQGVQFWSDPLTLSVIRPFQEWMGKASMYDWSTIHYKKILEVAAYKANPELYDKLKAGWPYQSKMWYRWQADIERMLKILSFRRTMRASLNQSII